jgi:hypothetical protein
MTALLRAISGLALWAVGFSVIYGLQGLVCALGLHSVAFSTFTIARLFLLLIYVAWLATHFWLWRRLWPRRAGPALLDRLAAGLALVGLVATAYTGFPVAVTATCN